MLQVISPTNTLWKILLRGRGFERHFMAARHTKTFLLKIDKPIFMFLYKQSPQASFNLNSIQTATLE